MGQMGQRPAPTEWPSSRSSVNRDGLGCRAAGRIQQAAIGGAVARDPWLRGRVARPRACQPRTGRCHLLRARAAGTLAGKWLIPV